LYFGNVGATPTHYDFEKDLSARLTTAPIKIDTGIALQKQGTDERCYTTRLDEYAGRSRELQAPQKNRITTRLDERSSVTEQKMPIKKRCCSACCEERSCISGESGAR